MDKQTRAWEASAEAVRWGSPFKLGEWGDRCGEHQPKEPTPSKEGGEV